MSGLWSELRDRARGPQPLWKRVWLKVKHWPGDFRYWLRCGSPIAWDRYHLIDIRGMDDYEWGWLDTDWKMELACWKLLVDFVEKEDPDVGNCKTVDEFWPDYDWPGGDEEREMTQVTVDRGLEVRELYDWWTLVRPQARQALEDMLDESFPDEHVPGTDAHWDVEKARLHWEEQERLDEQDTEMLVRLIRIRSFLWT